MEVSLTRILGLSIEGLANVHNSAMRLLASVSFVVLATASSFADDTATRKAIQARYAEISKAFASRNVKVFEAAFTDDFTASVAGRPKISRAETFRDFEGQMKVLSDVKWTQDITALKMDGKVAHVTINSLMFATAPGQDGKKHKLKLQTKGTKSDWVKGKKGWQVKYSETGDLKMWMDGKPLPMR